jgi:hypothetical protein
LQETGMPRLVMRLMTGFDLLGGQRPGLEAPADQNLVPVESRFNQRPLPIARGFLPAHPALLGEPLDVLVALNGLGVRHLMTRWARSETWKRSSEAR